LGGAGGGARSRACQQFEVLMHDVVASNVWTDAVLGARQRIIVLEVMARELVAAAVVGAVA